MTYNPNKHHRRSIRLKGYDYAQAGLYFVTICVQHRRCLFGNIQNGELHLNPAGKMIEKWYAELENKFPDILCHEKIIMPNHMHFIVENLGMPARKQTHKNTTTIPPVRDDLRVCPDENHEIVSNISETNEHIPIPNEHNPILGEHTGSPLHRVVQWFKTMTTNAYIRHVKSDQWERFDGKLWQRNYYERIIRDETAYQNISKYIVNNPKNWNGDKLRS